MLQLKKHTLFEHLKAHIPDGCTIVEAGAFRGQDTIRMAQTWPQSTIYSFEPVPEIFDQLKHNTQDYDNIHCFNHALADKNGMMQFWPSEHPKKKGVPSQAGSLLEPKERLKWSNISFNEPIEVQAATLDHWAKQHDVNAVDFLWLDMQGYELPVMQAAPKIMQTVKYVYTEVHFIQAYAGQYQHEEVITWLESQGFNVIAKDYQDTTSWFFGNIFLIRR